MRSLWGAWPGVIAVAALCCPALAPAATVTTGIDSAQSAMGVTAQACLQGLTIAVSDGENCLYDGGPSVLVNPISLIPLEPIGESTGPFSQAQYYSYLAVPASYDGVADSSFTAEPDDGKLRRAMGGSITIDDNGDGFGANDLVSATFIITSSDGGDIVRNLGLGVADRFTSMTQVMAPRTADSVTANAFGGFDYVIGTEGFPTLMVFTDMTANESRPGDNDGPCVGQTFGDMECDAGFGVNLFVLDPITFFPSFGPNPDPLRWTAWEPTDAATYPDLKGGTLGTPPSIGQFAPLHDHYTPQSAGLGSMEGNTGARTIGTLLNQQCIDDGSSVTGAPGATPCTGSKTSFGPLSEINGPNLAPGNGSLAEDVDWDHVYLKISTDARGNVITTEGFDLQEFLIFGIQLPCGSDRTENTFLGCNSWIAGHFMIAGVVAVADMVETPVDTPIDIDVLANDNGFVDPVTVTLPGGGTAAQGGTVVVNGSPGAQAGISVTYTPAAGFIGTDTFEYTVADATNTSTTAVTVDVLSPASVDTDADGIPDINDNCTLAPNGPDLPDAGGNVQLDTDGDGFGNLCDGDLNNDNLTNSLDLGLFKARIFTTDPDADHDGDGTVTSLDLGLFKAMFSQPPGPAGPLVGE